MPSRTRRPDEANEMTDPNLTKRTIEEGTGPLQRAAVKDDGSVVVEPANLFGVLDDEYNSALVKLAVSAPDGVDLLEIDAQPNSLHMLRVSSRTHATAPVRCS